MPEWTRKEIQKESWYDNLLKQREGKKSRPNPYCTCGSGTRSQYTFAAFAPHDCNARCSVCHGYTFLTEPPRLRRVLLESPFAGDIERNVLYARKCMRDCFLRGDVPLASHLLYTQSGVLDDSIPAERQLGISGGLEWGVVAEATIVYEDFGISNSMLYGIREATKVGRPIEYRTLN